MTLVEMCEDVSERTGWTDEAVLELALRQWPTLLHFSRTQRDLLVYLIQVKEQRHQEAVEALKKKFGVM